jgi:hypothetical protein
MQQTTCKLKMAKCGWNWTIVIECVEVEKGQDSILW